MDKSEEMALFIICTNNINYFLKERKDKFALNYNKMTNFAPLLVKALIILFCASL